MNPGRFLYTPPGAHRCTLPAPHPKGAVWRCSTCGATWVARWVAEAGTHRWYPEGRFARWRRERREKQ